MPTLLTLRIVHGIYQHHPVAETIPSNRVGRVVAAVPLSARLVTEGKGSHSGFYQKMGA